MISTFRTAAAGVMFLMALAACSAPGAAPEGVASLASSAPNADSSAAPSASLDPEAAMLAFAECMREQGIDMPDPETAEGPGGGGTFAFGGNGGDDGEFREALEACDKFLQQAQNIRGEIDPEVQDRMLEFAGCMREHGIDMPDPNMDGGITIQRSDEGRITNLDSGFDPSSPEFREAQEACQPILGDDFGPRRNSAPGGDTGPGLNINPEPARP
jgi:hypothetical protein